MKVKINTQNSRLNKEKYYSNLKNLLEKIDKDILNKIEKGNELSNDQDDFLGQSNFDQFSIRPSPQSIIKEECKICKANEFKYICPKCKIKYCSVKCYKEHSINCTEEFYKRCVEEEFQSTKIDVDAKKTFKKNLHNILNKQVKEDELYDQQKINDIYKNKIEHLQDILDKIENNTIDFSRDLSKEDWEHFNKFINGFSKENYFPHEQNNSQVSSLLRVWKPFWESTLLNCFEPNLNVIDKNLFFNYDEESKNNLKHFNINEFIEYHDEKIPEDNSSQSINNEINDEKQNRNEMEANEFNFSELNDLLDDINVNANNLNSLKFIYLNKKKVKINRDLIFKSILLKYENIPQLESLSRIPPSHANIFTLAKIIINSIYFFRLYNGELNDSSIILDIIGLIICNLQVLYEKNHVYNSFTDIFNEFSMFIYQNEFKHAQQILKLSINDLKTLFKNKFYIVETLLRIYEIIHRFLGDFSTDLDKFNDKVDNLDSAKYKQLLKNLKLAKHKILYYLSYTKSLDNNTLEDFVAEINKKIDEEMIIVKHGQSIKNYQPKK